MALLKKDSTTPETNIKPKNSPSRIAKTAKCLFPQITDLIKKIDRGRGGEGRGGEGRGGEGRGGEGRERKGRRGNDTMLLGVRGGVVVP